MPLDKKSSKTLSVHLMYNLERVQFLYQYNQICTVNTNMIFKTDTIQIHNINVIPGCY